MKKLFLIVLTLAATNLFALKGPIEVKYQYFYGNNKNPELEKIVTYGDLAIKFDLSKIEDIFEGLPTVIEVSKSMRFTEKLTPYYLGLKNRFAYNFNGDEDDFRTVIINKKQYKVFNFFLKSCAGEDDNLGWTSGMILEDASGNKSKLFGYAYYGGN